MRKIDKSIILSGEYKAWVDRLNEEGQKHPDGKYRKYYDDVFFNLLYCQKGVCAYTEKRLCSPGLISDSKWQDNRYVKCDEQKSRGHLEHFNPALKTGKYWEWENLFVIDSDINTKIKRDRRIDPILKPDAPDYDPHELLDYDHETDRFIPHTGIEDEGKKARIKYMIDTLGINADFIVPERRKYCNKFKKNLLEYNREEEIDEFYTAIEMLRKIFKDVK
jgi:hypothetical protein